MRYRPLSLRKLLIMAGLCLAATIGFSHGFEKQVEELADSDPGVIVNGRTYSVGELKNLVALRAAPAGDEFIYFSIADLIEVARLAPAYEKLAAEAATEGIALTPEDKARVEEFLRGYVERALYAEQIVSEREQPSKEELTRLYEEQKDRRFVLPERMIIRQLYFKDEASAQSAWKRLESGEEFAGLQREFPIDPSRGAVTDMINMTALEKQNAVMHGVLVGLKDKEYSKPFGFGDGYSIVQRQLHIPGSHMPYESVEQVLLDECINERDRAMLDEFFMRLAGESRLLRIRPQNLTNTGALALDSDVLLSIGDRHFTRGELRGLVGWQLAADLPQNERTFSALVLRTGPVQRALIDYLIAEKGLMETDEVKQLRLFAEQTALVNRLLDKRYPGNKEAIGEDTIESIARARRVELNDETRADIIRDIEVRRRYEFDLATLESAAVGVEIDPVMLR